ncbi:MAG: hypothetical protein JNN30_08850 [Rhodanobacteraceae bacterium]|nr:hypothetical protein [Rhodanobacteraceae bacterium]
MEVLDSNCLLTLTDAREKTQRWMPIYIGQRSHRAIGNLPPMAFIHRW